MQNATGDIQKKSPFAVKDCALITIATGIKVQNLKEFASALKDVPTGSIYHHFWGRLLRALFDEPEYNNDFASWASRGLHDKQLAEQLSMVIPTDYKDLEGLRQETLEVVEQRLDESEIVPWAQADQQFHFLKSQIVVFDTGIRYDHPAELVPQISRLSTGSIYYHFIDARNRTDERHDDFSSWLNGFDGDEFEELTRNLCGMDPYFSSLKEIRLNVSNIFQKFFAKGEQ
jgi:AcrR family transcriptional regulator